MTNAWQATHASLTHVKHCFPHTHAQRYYSLVCPTPPNGARSPSAVSKLSPSSTCSSGVPGAAQLAMRTQSGCSTGKHAVVRVRVKIMGLIIVKS
eukprot:COSAG01_NODE_146_length_24099_cov_25.341208_37_plen_95_part_00